MSGQAADIPDASPRPAGQGLLRRNLRAVLTAAAITLVVQLGAFCAARKCMLAGRAEEIANLPPEKAAALVARLTNTADVTTALLSALWIVVAAPIFAAGGRGLADGLLRGGSVADTGAVVLIVLAAGGDAIALSGAVGLYLIWLSIALAESAVVALARRPTSRHVVAAVAAVLVLAISAAPFWANAAVLALRGPWRLWACRAIVAANPVFATSQCLTDQVEFVWNERPILYEHGVLGRDVPRPAVGWHVTAIAYALAAAAAAALAVIRRRRSGTPPLPPASAGPG